MKPFHHVRYVSVSSSLSRLRILVVICLLWSFFACNTCKKPPRPRHTNNHEITDEMITTSKNAGSRFQFLTDCLIKLQKGQPVGIDDTNTNNIDRGRTALSYAAELGDVIILKALLRLSPDVNKVDDVYHRPPLHWAVHFGQADIVQALLKVPNIRLDIKADYTISIGDPGKTPLKYAYNFYNTNPKGSQKWLAYKRIIEDLEAQNAPMA